MSPLQPVDRLLGVRPSRRPSLTVASLAALAASLLLGLVGHATGDARLGVLADALKPIGDLWIAALQMTVFPLVIAYTLAAIVGVGREGAVAALAGRAVLLFLAMLAAAGLLTIALAPPLVALFPVDQALIAALKAATSIPEAARQTASAGHGSLADWIAGLLPRNLFEAAVRGNILPTLLFTVLFGIAVTRLPEKQRDPLSRTFQALAAAMLVCVRWILVFTPIGVFVFTFRFALGTGGEAVGVLGAWVVIVSGLLLLCTVLLYPASAFLGRITVRSFARGVAPAQLVAVSTRSSIASLPALVEGARERLKLPDTAAAFVLPLSVSLFKLNPPISSTAKLIFLAHVYGIPLTTATLATFLLTVMVLSFSTVGLPSGGTTFRTLPAYLAAGLPIEGVVILEAVETIPDIFKTLLNVTADMSAATLLSRSSRGTRPEGAATDEARPVGGTV
ncbi:MAG: dicarboxylate/amino acid:cation symporter [Thermoanaerobaculia bacterium]